MDSEPTAIKVLVVGDSKVRLTSLYAYLRSMDIQPLTAEAGHDAIDIYRREQPDIILMQDQLTDIDCFEFAREIHALDIRNNWTSIIFLCNSTEDKDWECGID